MEQWKGKKAKVAALLQGLTAAFLVTVVLLLLFAFVMLKLQPDAGQTKLGILLIDLCACLAGGWLCGHRAERKRFLWGLLTGLLYFLLLFAVSGLTDPATAPELAGSLFCLAICAGGGMLGGMLS